MTVALGVVAILVALLLPALGSAKKKAIDARCRSNVRQIGMGLTAFAGEMGAFPTESGIAWIASALPQDSRKLLACPASKGSSYSHNRWGASPAFSPNHLGLGPHSGRATKAEAVKVPVECVMVLDPVTVMSPPLRRPGGSVIINTNHPLFWSHGSAANVLFVDGHAERVAVAPFAEGRPEIRRLWNVDNEPHDEYWPWTNSP